MLSIKSTELRALALIRCICASGSSHPLIFFASCAEMSAAASFSSCSTSRPQPEAPVLPHPSGPTQSTVPEGFAVVHLQFKPTQQRTQRARLVSPLSALALAALAALALALPAAAQQTLGGITGTVLDPSGSAVPGVEVKAVSDDTQLVRTAKSNAQGSYQLNDLPIGRYTVTFSLSGFSTVKFPGILVQADRTATLPAQLAVGAVSDSVTVDFNPLMNAVDTTNGYVLDKAQIEAIPLPTGSFTGVAILSPGVNAELPGGTGANSGLGNAPIWANGQRDTSNTFQLNGVDASALFNGKSTSQVASGRVVNSTGVGNAGGGGTEQSSASVYLSIGNSIPTPAPETIQEVRVNASMYDAQQGSTSGAHIDLSTASGTNQFHGTAYAHRGTNFINAAPFFFKQDPSIPAYAKNPGLHRYIAGGTFGGPIIKDKLFGFVAYQHLHVADNEIGDTVFDVPTGLSNDRSAAGLQAIANTHFNGNIGVVDPIALALFNIPSVAGEPGRYLIPNDTSNGRTLTAAYENNAFLPGTAYFIADQAVADLDYNATSKDTLALKYYYQHDPTTAPYAYSNVPGFTQHLDAGAQVISLTNSYLVKSNLSTQQSFGFLREKIFSTNSQLFGPSSIPGTAAAIANAGSYFPGVSIVNVLGDQSIAGVSNIFSVGPNAEAQGSNTGVFQNRFQPSGNAIWTLGKHTISFGANYSYTQLNTIDKRTGTGTIATDDYSQFLQGLVTPGGAYSAFYVTSFLQGNANRYYRANQLGSYVQDKFQIRPNLSLTAGVRYDWDGGLSEKYGRIFNFDGSPCGSTPTAYCYNATSDTITNSGIIIAGNNVNGTPGISNTTLTGRQWGIGPRVGAAWQPEMFHNKVVVRAGSGIYYDRGQLFTYFSPGYAIGTVTGGPFGVNQSLPFVNDSSCAPASFYEGFLPTCGPGSLENPWGPLLAAPKNPKSSDIVADLPTLNGGYQGGINNGAQPLSLGVYDRANKLPYTINYTLDIQWQPRNDLAITLGYVGNLGRHQIIPVPFNQAGIASPSSPIHGEQYTYGYTVGGSTLPNGNGYDFDFEGGNVDHRVPYIGYANESIDYKAAGVDAYNALTAHIEKRMSHGLQVAASYTYSHELDEQSAIGLFYNGNNPNNLRDGYASGDFDRTHVINFNYAYRLPNFAKERTLTGDFIDGWSLVGLTVLQSGQPYSVVDFTGAVGSIFYSTNNGITNPIIPLAPGCTAKTAKTGASGAFTPDAGGTSKAALNPACFQVQTLKPGALNGAIPTSDPYETNFTTGQRNIFRQAFQKRADASLVKMTPLTERYTLKYTFDVYNLTNTTSFDIPGNEPEQNVNFNSFPNAAGSYGQVAPTGNTCATAAGQATANPNNPATSSNYFYNCPVGIGETTRAIGSSRQIQMSLSLVF